jgi:hypothetical protein
VLGAPGEHQGAKIQMKILRALTISAILSVIGMAQDYTNIGLIGPTSSTITGSGTITLSAPSWGTIQNLTTADGTGAFVCTATNCGSSGWIDGHGVFVAPVGFNGREIRKDDGKGPTLQDVKLSAKLIKSGMLAPAEYLELAKHIGLDPSASTDEAELLEAIQHGGFHVYDFDKVDGYLWRQALKEKSPSDWVWKTLRKTDWESMVAENGHLTAPTASGVLSVNQYANTLPLRIMKDVAAILDCFPDAKFLVSDYEVKRPDPFLAVTTPRLFAAGKVWIIDCWDGPGFTEAK